MDNTPTAEADSLDVRMSPMARFLRVNATRIMWESISRAASSCPNAATAKHHFSGYPRQRARCRSCGTPLFREE
ncbi:hypothetical protein LCGC14_1386100 [marine sediment metagenome]|uniref:Uncharacterized protein n=1 Tax=marine sediment metagenome TaxID=412755 RepID=A0A0F9KM73_9ZZZZ